MVPTRVVPCANTTVGRDTSEEIFVSVYSLYELPPCARARYTPNLATLAEAPRILPGNVVISVPGRGVPKLLPLINIWL